MFGVTVHTTEIRIGVIHLAMRLGNFRHVGGQFCMTVCTAVGHSLRGPGRDMAGFAIASRCRVGGDAAH